VREVNAIALTNKVGLSIFLLGVLGIDKIPGFGRKIVAWGHHTLMQQTVNVYGYVNSNS